VSAVNPHCDHCDLDRVFVRVAPFGNASTYAVEWRCPKCDSHILEMCPVGPLAPTADTCLNCGAAITDPGDNAECPACAMTRNGAEAFFGLHPASDDPVAAAGALFDQGLIRRALATLNYALIFHPSLEAAWRTKYSFLSGLGYIQAACTVIEAAIEHVVNPDLLISYACVLRDLKRHQDAIEVYREYLLTVLDGEYAGIALCNMANSTLELDDSVAAEVLYRRAIDKEPGRASHYSNYVRLLLNEKRFDAALPLIEKGLSLAPEAALAAKFLEDKALIFAEQKRSGESLEAADAAIARGASGVRVHYLRGRALALLGQLTEARQCMQQVLRMDPDNADALRARKMIDEALRHADGGASQ
jgi:tetratricopeptide (TPR) repeat protein